MYISWLKSHTASNPMVPYRSIKLQQAFRGASTLSVSQCTEQIISTDLCITGASKHIYLQYKN